MRTIIAYHLGVMVVFGLFDIGVMVVLGLFDIGVMVVLGLFLGCLILG